MMTSRLTIYIFQGWDRCHEIWSDYGMHFAAKICIPVRKNVISSNRHPIHTTKTVGGFALYISGLKWLTSYHYYLPHDINPQGQQHAYYKCPMRNNKFNYYSTVESDTTDAIWLLIVTWTRSLLKSGADDYKSATKSKRGRGQKLYQYCTKHISHR